MNKNGLQKLIKDRIRLEEKVVIEFGPGEKKSFFNAIGIDVCEKETVDFIADLNQGLLFLEDDSVDVIYSNHFLEHIDDLEFFLQEIYRVLKPGGKKIGTVPHFSNPYFYSDYTHKSFWGLYTLNYFSSTRYFKRQVPKYYNKIDFEIEKIKLEFKSPFYIRSKIKMIFSKIINSSSYLQEFYEENLTYIVPAYEIYFEIKKKYE